MSLFLCSLSSHPVNNHRRCEIQKDWPQNSRRELARISQKTKFVNGKLCLLCLERKLFSDFLCRHFRWTRFSLTDRFSAIFFTQTVPFFFSLCPLPESDFCLFLVLWVFLGGRGGRCAVSQIHIDLEQRCDAHKVRKKKYTAVFQQFFFFILL